MKAGLLAVGIAAAALMPGGKVNGPMTVDVTIHHGASHQHTVEFQAFSATGRLLMSHRSRATRHHGR